MPRNDVSQQNARTLEVAQRLRKNRPAARKRAHGELERRRQHRQTRPPTGRVEQADAGELEPSSKSPNPNPNQEPKK